MRWDALFAEVAAHEHDRRALGRDAEARDLAEAEWGERVWRAPLPGRDIDLQAMGGLAVRGTVAGVTDTWIAVEAAGEDVIVAIAHVVEVTVVSPSEIAWPEADAGEPSVAARLGWGHVLRAAGHERLRFVGLDGRVRTGVVEAVGRDFVRIDVGSGSSVLLPFATLVAVRARA